MTKILSSCEKTFQSKLKKLLADEGSNQSEISLQVSEIINQVKERKDSALIDYTKIYDNVTLTLEDLKVSEEEISLIISQVSKDESEAIKFAAQRIFDYHSKQIPKDKFWTDESGVKLGWVWRSINRVGVYVPGGTASYPSSVLMNAIPASIAGVKKILMTTPMGVGGINPLVILAAKIAGVTEIYRVGGAQAIAALAFGTSVISPVNKIVGPGNAFVAEAKRQVFGRVGIDMVAGPSEVLIIADEQNNPEWIAFDLLSQAEHDINAKAVLITNSSKLANDVEASIKKNLSKLSRKKIAEKSWTDNGLIILVKNLLEGCDLANLLAPEHLQICVKNPEKLLNKIDNAGSIFLGKWTPEALGDYVVGPNHVLPTGGTAKFSSGLSVTDFMKRVFVSKASQESIIKIGGHGEVLARSESLGAHEKAIRLRRRN